MALTAEQRQEMEAVFGASTITPEQQTEMEAIFATPVEPTPYDPTELVPTTVYDPLLDIIPREEMVRQRKNVRDIATETGIGTQGAPKGAQEWMAYSPEGMELEGIRNFFKKEYPDADVRVRVGPNTQEPEFSVDGGKTFTLVNNPDLTVEDVEAAIPGVKALGTEVVGGVAGAGAGAFATGAFPPSAFVANPATGAAAGAAMGTYFSEMERLERGKELGAHNLTESEMAEKARSKAWTTAAFDLGLLGMGKLYRMYKGRKVGAIGDVIEEADVEEAIKNQEELRKAVKEATGLDYEPTLGQSLAPTVPGKASVMRTEEEIAAALPRGRLAENLAAQREVVEEITARGEREFGLRPEDVSAQRVGERIQEEARRRPEAMRRRLEQEAKRAEQTAITLADDISEGTVNYVNLGEFIQTSLQEGRDATQRVMSQRYKDFGRDAKAADITSSLAKTRRAAKIASNKLKKDIIPSLGEEDKRIFNDILGAPESVGMEQMQRAISSLRTVIRDAEKGVTATSDIVQLRKMRDALVRDRNEALKGNPELRRRLAAIENDYRKTKTAIDNSLIGDFIFRKPNGEYRISSDRIVDRILANPQGAKQIVSALNDPNLVFNPAIKGDIKSGLVDKYVEAVVDATGKVNPVAHKRFMKTRNREVMNQFFTPAELEKFEKASTASQFVKSFDAKRKRLDGLLSKTFAVDIQKGRASQFISNIFQEGRVEDIRRLKSVLSRFKKSDPALWNDFQKRAQYEMKKRIGNFEAASQAFIVSPEKLGGALTNPDFVGLTREVFGEQYVKDLTAVNRIVQSFTTPAGSAKELILREAAARSGIGVSALRTTVAKPLSPQGRALSGVMQYISQKAPGKLDEILSDPGELRNLMKLRKFSNKDIAKYMATSRILQDVVFEEEE